MSNKIFLWHEPPSISTISQFIKVTVHLRDSYTISKTGYLKLTYWQLLSSFSLVEDIQMHTIRIFMYLESWNGKHISLCEDRRTSLPYIRFYIHLFSHPKQCVADIMTVTHWCIPTFQRTLLSLHLMDQTNRI